MVGVGAEQLVHRRHDGAEQVGGVARRVLRRRLQRTRSGELHRQRPGGQRGQHHRRCAEAERGVPGGSGGDVAAAQDEQHEQADDRDHEGGGEHLLGRHELREGDEPEREPRDERSPATAHEQLVRQQQHQRRQRDEHQVEVAGALGDQVRREAVQQPGREPRPRPRRPAAGHPPHRGRRPGEARHRQQRVRGQRPGGQRDRGGEQPGQRQQGVPHQVHAVGHGERVGGPRRAPVQHSVRRPGEEPVGLRGVPAGAGGRGAQAVQRRRVAHERQQQERQRREQRPHVPRTRQTATCTGTSRASSGRSRSLSSHIGRTVSRSSTRSSPRGVQPGGQLLAVGDDEDGRAVEALDVAVEQPLPRRGARPRRSRRRAAARTARRAAATPGVANSRVDAGAAALVGLPEVHPGLVTGQVRDALRHLERAGPLVVRAQRERLRQEQREQPAERQHRRDAQDQPVAVPPREGEAERERDEQQQPGQERRDVPARPPQQPRRVPRGGAVEHEQRQRRQQHRPHDGLPPAQRGDGDAGSATKNVGSPTNQVSRFTICSSYERIVRPL